MEKKVCFEIDREQEKMSKLVDIWNIYNRHLL